MARGREGFVDGDGHGGQFGARHAREVQQREGGVDEGDVDSWGCRWRLVGVFLFLFVGFGGRCCDFFSKGVWFGFLFGEGGSWTLDWNDGGVC